MLVIDEIDGGADDDGGIDGACRVVRVRNWLRKEKSTGFSRLEGVVEGLMVTLKVMGCPDDDGCIIRFVPIDDDDDVDDICGIVSFAGGAGEEVLSVKILLLDTITHVRTRNYNDT